VDHASIGHSAEVLARNTDRQVDLWTSPEVRSHQRGSEQVVPLGAAGHAGQVLGPDLCIGR
jgi:hypothetical protein